MWLSKTEKWACWLPMVDKIAFEVQVLGSAKMKNSIQEWWFVARSFFEPGLRWEKGDFTHPKLFLLQKMQIKLTSSQWKERDKWHCLVYITKNWLITINKKKKKKKNNKKRKDICDQLSRGWWGDGVHFKLY